MNYFKIFLITLVTAVFVGCQKTEYSLGVLKAPSSVEFTATVLGTDAENPDGDGSGKVFISASATDKISYRIDFGDGNSQIVHTDTFTYTYRTPGTNQYILSVNAIGAGGTISTASTQVKVFVNFVIPDEIVEALTGNTSKIWVLDKDAPGHLGNDPADRFDHYWWNIGPNDSEKAPAYDDEVTFSLDEIGNIFMKVDNKGQSFLIGAATEFYGFNGADGPYPLVNDENKKLTFMEATTLSIPHTSSGIQFVVPGNGIVIFGSGGNTYEIISISSTKMELRGLGIDPGIAWYQKLTVKP